MSVCTRRAGRALSARQALRCCTLAPPPPAEPASAPAGARGRLTEAQRGWWVLGPAGTFVAMLGFQALPPARRLDVIEAVNARQDSATATQAVEERVALDTIRRQLGQLLAGQCAKERDGMARVFYGCGGR